MKKLIAAAVFTAMLASLVSCGRNASASDGEYIYGKIDSVSGNDVVLLLADYNEDASDTTKSSEKDKDTESSEEKGSKKSRRPENGEMPEGFDPENFKGEKPEGFSRSKGKESSGSSKYTLTGEQEELRIPVGTTVTTSLGVKTDFDALSKGDIIKCCVTKNSDGEDVVTEVWIMEQ